MKWPWAVGGGDLVLPEDVGMPIGEGKRWLVLQTHYFNPNLDEGITDASGVRAYVTTDLRAQEAGVLQLDGGTGDWQRSPLPSGESDHQLATFVVPGDCTAAIWNQPLNVVGIIHHMHLYGEEMKIQVEREGLNLGPMRYERHYDFNHQSLEEPSANLKQLFPGDQISMDCLYDTTKATDSVSFGDLTQQEMCYGAIVYYPRNFNDDLGYMPPEGNAEYCLSPATEQPFLEENLSLCTQELFDNVPRFFDIEDQVPAPFGALEMCNGGDVFDDLLSHLPGFCPSCQLTSNCTEGEVRETVQGFCGAFCMDIFGVSVYPATNATEPFDSGAYGCPTSFFKAPVIVAPPACELVGNLEEEIRLNEFNLTKLNYKTTSGASSAQYSSIAFFASAAGAMAWCF